MRQNKAPRHSSEDDEETTEPTATGQRERDTLTEETEATLEEIDDVLEDNAEEFVRSYVQKGGE